MPMALSATQIVLDMNRIRAEDYPTARAQPEALFVENLGPTAIAALAMVERWRGWDLGYKMGSKTIRELIAEGTGLSNYRNLDAILVNLAKEGMVEVKKKSGFLSSKVYVEWSAAGREICYAYLNRWGWDRLSSALERHSHSGFGTGPPMWWPRFWRVVQPLIP